MSAAKYAGWRAQRLFICMTLHSAMTWVWIFGTRENRYDKILKAHSELPGTPNLLRLSWKIVKLLSAVVNLLQLNPAYRITGCT